MPSVTLEYYGIEATGRNVTEAKKAAGKRIERIIRDLTPKIFSHKGYSVVISPTEHGWMYQIVHPDASGSQHGASLFGDCKDDCITSAVRHLLDMGRNIGEFDFPDWASSWGVSKDQTLSEWSDSDAFTRAYRHAESVGESDPHSWACHHRDEFRD